MGSTTDGDRQSQLELLVMRHSKAAYPDGVSDHERPLAKRGLRDSRVMGEWLAEFDLVPDLIICSDATRTRETSDGVVAGLGAEVAIRATPELYECGVRTVLGTLAHVPDDVSRLLLVGHEPTMSATVAALTGQWVVYPTSTIGVIRLDVSQWAEIDADTGSLLQLHGPKD